MNLNFVHKLIIAAICSISLIGTATADDGTSVLGTTAAEADLFVHGWRMSKLNKATVYNDSDEKVGKIEDFIVTRDGTITFAIMNLGGFMGYGNYLVSIPIHKFSQMIPKPILPKATKSELGKLPRFEYKLILGQ